MAQLMYRVVLGFESRKLQIFVNHPLHGLLADAESASAEEECAFLLGFLCLFPYTGREALLHIIQNDNAAGIVQIDDALLCTFSDDTHGAEIAVEIVQIDSAQLRKTHAAVQKERNDGIVPHHRLGGFVIFDRLQ